MVNENIAEEQHIVKRHKLEFETEDVEKRDWELLHKYVNGLLAPTKWYDTLKSNAFGAFITGWLSLIPYGIGICMEKNDRVGKFQENLIAILIIFIFIIATFVIYKVCGKVHSEHENIIYYSKSVVQNLLETMDQKNGFTMPMPQQQKNIVSSRELNPQNENT